MEVALFVLSFCLAVPSITMAIDNHRNANWQKVQALTYLCSQKNIPEEYIKQCKDFTKNEKQNDASFFLEEK